MASISIPSALLIAGGASAAGGVASGIMGANAATSAAKVQAAAAEKAAQAQLDMFGQVKEQVQPFVDFGKGAIPMAEGLLGTGPNGTAGIQGALEATPGYQFTRTQGLQAVTSAASAQGLAGSGSWTKAAEQYATGLANSTYEQRLQDYLSTVGFGAQTASSLGGMALGSQKTASDYSTSGAAAKAAGIVGSNQALTGGINSALSGLGNNSLLYGLYNAGMFGAGTGQAPGAASGMGSPF